MFSRSFAVRAIDEFRQRLLDNLLTIRREGALGDFAVPVGLFLVLDEANGGNGTAEELIRRFGFLDLEGRQVVDFYFLGRRVGEDRSPAFDLEAFKACRDALRTAEIREFGGYADGAATPITRPTERLERFVADAELMVDVAALGVDFFVAEIIFRGVRTGGGPVSLPFAWGFGRI